MSSSQRTNEQYAKEDDHNRYQVMRGNEIERPPSRELKKPGDYFEVESPSNELSPSFTPQLPTEQGCQGSVLSNKKSRDKKGSQREHYPERRILPKTSPQQSPTTTPAVHAPVVTCIFIIEDAIDVNGNLIPPFKCLNKTRRASLYCRNIQHRLVEVPRKERGFCRQSVSSLGRERRCRRATRSKDIKFCSAPDHNEENESKILPR